jgi:drug/metabolite transporter (DMT)-like permease
VSFRKYLVLAAVAVFAALGDMCLKIGMNQGSQISIDNLHHAFFSIFNVWVAVGILFLIGFFACYLTALSWADLTYVLPATAFGYVIIALLSVFVLHETVSVARWIGIVLVTSGVGFVAGSPPRQSAAEKQTVPTPVAVEQQV